MACRATEEVGHNAGFLHERGFTVELLLRHKFEQEPSFYLQ